MNTKTFLLGTVLALGATLAPAADLRSNFKNDDNGWRGAGDLQSFGWAATGGHPGGHLQGVDGQSGSYWYFVSPIDWAGDWRRFKSLSFDQRQVGPGSLRPHRPDVIIVGANGVSLEWDSDRVPGAIWSRFDVPLVPATFGVDRAAFKAVMSNVVEVRIRGEFVLDEDEGGLDTVVLAERPR